MVLAPTFAEYEQALESVDCQVEHYFLKEEEGFAAGSELLEVLDENLDMVFLCNPKHPTGLQLERDFLLSILKRCREKAVFLVVDECFLDFVKEPEAYTLKSVLEEADQLFLLKAFTKRYAMAGVRLGYGLCRDQELLSRMERMTQPWNVSTMAQEAGIAALMEREYVEAGRQLVFSEAAWLKEEMKKLGLMVFPSQANYIFFKGPGSLFTDCVKKGILIRDCSNYPGLCKGYYRIAVKKHEDNVKLIGALQEIMAG